MKRIAVLGGGVSGVVMARHLNEKGTATIDLIEKEERLGGLHRSICFENLVFDIGAFIFFESHELLRSFPLLFDCLVHVVPVSLSITPQGNVCQYPITMQNYLRENGLLSLASAVPDLLLSRIRYKNRDSVPAFAKYYMGAQIYRRSGLQHYLERFYGIRDEEVGLEFALQRLALLQNYTPVAVIRSKLRSMFRRIASIPEPPALVRPREGFQEMYRRIAASLTEQGVNVQLGCSATSVRRTTDGRFHIDFGDRTERYDRVVSTIPIPVMLHLLGIAPQTRFEHMSLVSQCYRGRIRHDAAILYNFTLSGLWKRITIFSSFYGTIDGDDYFTVETTTRDTSPENLERIQRDFETHAAQMGLLVPGTDLRRVGVHVTERAYPVFQRGTSEALQLERDRLKAAGIDFVGRQGSFKYISAHDAAQQASSLADEIVGEG